MADLTVLLLGADGQLGTELRRALAGPQLVALGKPQIDFARPESLREVVRRHQPDVIVNSAAYTAVDRAESEPGIARAVNALAPAVLAQEAATLGARLVHFSTDYVFDGAKSTPYVESDTSAPLSVYGRTKLEGEHAVATAPRHLILRTSWVVGAYGHNFLKTILRLAGEREALKVVDDQVGAPTAASLLADMTALALTKSEHNGIYHLTAAGATSWYGLARHVVSRAQSAGVPLKAGPDQIVPIPASDYPAPATRPANSRLDTSKFRKDFSTDLPDWRIGVDTVIDAVLSKVSA